MATSKDSGNKSGSAGGNAQKSGNGGPAKRGFAAMDENQQREIASKGGESRQSAARNNKESTAAAKAGAGSRQGGKTDE